MILLFVWLKLNLENIYLQYSLLKTFKYLMSNWMDGGEW